MKTSQFADFETEHSNKNVSSHHVLNKVGVENRAGYNPPPPPPNEGPVPLVGPCPNEIHRGSPPPKTVQIEVVPPFKRNLKRNRHKKSSSTRIEEGPPIAQGGLLIGGVNEPLAV